MTTAQQKTTEEQGAASTREAAVSDVLIAWDRVFKGGKAQVRTNAALVASDLRLSLKAVVVTLISIVMLVGLGIVVWVSLLVGLTYGLTFYGLHWLWSFLLVLVLNVVALVVTKRILSSAIDSIKMTATVESLFNTQRGRD